MKHTCILLLLLLAMGANAQSDTTERPKPTERSVVFKQPSNIDSANHAINLRAGKQLKIGGGLGVAGVTCMLVGSAVLAYYGSNTNKSGLRSKTALYLGVGFSVLGVGATGAGFASIMNAGYNLQGIEKP